MGQQLFFRHLLGWIASWFSLDAVGEVIHPGVKYPNLRLSRITECEGRSYIAYLPQSRSWILSHAQAET